MFECKRMSQNIRQNVYRPDVSRLNLYELKIRCYRFYSKLINQSETRNWN